MNPAGPVQIVDTATGISTAGINFTLQVKFCEDPEIILIVGGIIVTETGGGTENKNLLYMSMG